MNSWDVLGLITPSGQETNKTVGDPAMETVHKAAVDCIKKAREEFEKLRKEAQDANKGFEEFGPREYGGKVCEHCEEVDGIKVYTYYVTKTPGSWRTEFKKWDKKADGTVDPEKAPDCTGDDKKVGLWHTHPGRYNGDEEKTYTAGQWFSGGDMTVTNGYIGEDNDTGEKRHFNHPKNPDGVPLYMTRQTGDATNEFETYRYNPGGQVDERASE
jgi:hypothetical protein